MQAYSLTNPSRATVIAAMASVATLLAGRRYDIIQPLAVGANFVAEVNIHDIFDPPVWPGTVTVASVASSLASPSATPIQIRGQQTGMINIVDYKTAIDASWSAPLARAMMALSSKGGGVINLPGGVLNIDTPVAALSGVTLKGIGAGLTRLVVATTQLSGFNDSSGAVAWFKLEDLTIEGSSTPTEGQTVVGVNFTSQGATKTGKLILRNIEIKKLYRGVNVAQFGEFVYGNVMATDCTNAPIYIGSVSANRSGRVIPDGSFYAENCLTLQGAAGAGGAVFYIGYCDDPGQGHKMTFKNCGPAVVPFGDSNKYHAFYGRAFGGFLEATFTCAGQKNGAAVHLYSAPSEVRFGDAEIIINASETLHYCAVRADKGGRVKVSGNIATSQANAVNVSDCYLIVEDVQAVDNNVGAVNSPFAKAAIVIEGNSRTIIRNISVSEAKSASGAVGQTSILSIIGANGPVIVDDFSIEAPDSIGASMTDAAINLCASGVYSGSPVGSATDITVTGGLINSPRTLLLESGTPIATKRGRFRDVTRTSSIAGDALFSAGQMTRLHVGNVYDGTTLYAS